jgi:DNA-binding GntR family transcriptional regulator
VLRDAILDFRIKPGQRLIERELIEQTGVSRTTIREVLRQLAAEGLVTTIPQKGAIVVVPSPAEAADLYEVRIVLEAAAVRRFLEQASPGQVRALRAAADRAQRTAAREPDDVRALLRETDALYATLLEGAGNAAITEILTGVQARLRVMRASSLAVPGRAADSAAELARLVTAIERGDAVAAVAHSTDHLQRAVSAGLDALAAAEAGSDLA